MDEENKGFKVKDSRRYTAEGKAREPEGESRSPAEEHKGENFTARPAPDAQRIPEMSFATFVLSLHASAMVHLGLIGDPDTGEMPPPHIPMAQQTIDILALLQEKTKGNLTREEQELLQGALYELRVQFVNRQKPGGRRAS